MTVTPNQLRSWRKRAETIKRSAERLMDEMMEAEGYYHTPDSQMLLSDWADNISSDADSLIDGLRLLKIKLNEISFQLAYQEESSYSIRTQQQETDTHGNHHRTLGYPSGHGSRSHHHAGEHSRPTGT